MPMADRISTLPDDVLCHILSFLPTEEVVSTSVLSKRWRTLWLSVLSLDFDEDRFAINDKPYSDFSMFINRTILARDVRLPIRRFSLKCLCWCGSYDMLDSDVNGWVNNAIQRGVENLDIDMYLPHRILYLKGCIFTCRTLVVLKLGGLTVESLSSICLPSLKRLQLVDATFFGPQNLRTLLIGCPNLEDLEARDIHFNDHGDSGEWRSLPMLVKAHIYHVDVNIPSKAISNVQWLCIDKLDDVILVFTNLTHLELLYGTHMNWRQVHAVLNQCPKLKKFDLYLLRSPIGFVWPFPRLDPQCFSSHLDKCSIINYKGTEYELQFVKFILQRARVLRTMIIYTLPSCDQDELLEELSLWPRTSTTCELVIE